jgi:flagellar basal-body rod protein FlgC
MSSEIFDAMKISAAGMRAQGTRLRVISENVANADTTGTTPGADPYARQVITFKNVLDKEINAKMVEVDKIRSDRTKPFEQRYMPDHPAANTDGYVKVPNVNSLIEIMDVREAQRSYEANLGMIDQSRSMASRTIELLRR